MTEVKCKNCGAGGHSELGCSYKKGAFRHKHKWSQPAIAKFNEFSIYAVIACEHCGEIKKKDIRYD